MSVKTSQIPNDPTPLVGDSVVGVKASGPTTQDFSLSSLITLFWALANVPTGATSPITRDGEANSNFVSSGLLWSADAAGSTKNASMTTGICYINGRRISVAAVTARTFTASKDTYVDILDNGDGTGTLVYTEVTNNAASPVLAANSVRIATVVTGATNIAASTSIGQGGFANTLPVISSQIFKGFDSLGNIIYPKGPSSARKTQNTAAFSIYRAGATTSSNTAGGTLISHDTKVFDSSNSVDVTTHLGRFTASVAGLYWFAAQASNTAATSTLNQSFLFKNGVQAKVGQGLESALNGGQSGGLVTGLLLLAAADYVEHFFIGGGGSVLAVGQANCWFDGYLVTATP